MKNLIKLIVFSGLIITVSCKKKTVEAEENYINGVIRLTDAGSLPKKHKLNLELYANENDEFPEIEFEINIDNIVDKIVIKKTVDYKQFGSYIVKLSIVETAVKKIELINYGKIQIEKNCILPDKTITIASFSRLKKQLFHKCSLCHGENPDHMAANLNLMPDSCYNSIVNKPAKNSDLFIVKPFKPESSFILKVLRQETDFEHSASTNIWFTEKELLENWIKQGAQHN